jgi:D-glycero-D-manno-heptose 1,7-bisphosphate phosphatase
LIEQAVARYSLELSQCYLVGDKRSDLEAAQQVAVPGVLVMTSPYSKAAVQARDEGQVAIEYVAETFTQAVAWIEQQVVKHVNRTGSGR